MRSSVSCGLCGCLALGFLACNPGPDVVFNRLAQDGSLDAPRSDEASSDGASSDGAGRADAASDAGGSIVNPWDLCALISKQAVLSDAGCEWVIPTNIPGSPEGLDPAKVLVGFFEKQNPDSLKFMGKVKGPGECTTADAAAPPLLTWYFDNEKDPTKIIACPVTCDQIKPVLNTFIRIGLGCDLSSFNQSRDR